MIHEILIKLREEKGWSQEKAAGEMGVSRSALGYYERGTRNPDAEFIITVARLFGVTTDFLLGLSEYRTLENQALALSSKLPLSDKAFDFIKSCPAELLPTLDGFLSDKNTTWFFGEFAAYVSSLDSYTASKVAEELAARLAERGTSKTAPEVVRMLAEKLTPAIQQTTLISALKAVADSMKEKADGSAGAGQDGAEKA